MRLMLEMMSGFQMVSKLYEKHFHTIREKYHVTQIEIDILAFLTNNPTYDTASDIVKYRMLPKANVSQAVELLIQKNMLKRTPDEKDRRKIHLKAQKESEELLADILTEQNIFLESLFDGIPQGEREQYMRLYHRMLDNVKKGLKTQTEDKYGTEK